MAIANHMKHIHGKKGYQLQITGAPALDSDMAGSPSRLALLPEKIPFVKPRLKVQKGDRVQLGSPLFEDKRNTDIRFLSPGSGLVEEIKFGPRRVIQEIIVKLDETEEKVSFAQYSATEVCKLSRAQLVQAIIDGGLWPLIRELPCRDYARPDFIPPAIYVGLGSLEPFQPEPMAYLSGQEALFRYGLKVLGKLTDQKIFVATHHGNTAVLNALSGAVNLTYAGPYPAHDPGVLLYRMKTSAEQNPAWYLDGQDVLSIARLLQEGVYPTARSVVLAGPGATRPRHIHSRLGAPLSILAGEDFSKQGYRYIEGGILTGFPAPQQSYLGFFETALNLLPEGDHRGEFLGLFAPGYRKPTYSKAFLSTLNRGPLEIDCNMHGGYRACIACGYCALVCPVDILPQFTYKAIQAGEVEEALEHGLLDCVECGLCSYVCPSKIELVQAFKTARADYHKEQAKL